MEPASLRRGVDGGPFPRGVLGGVGIADRLVARCDRREVSVAAKRDTDPVSTADHSSSQIDDEVQSAVDDVGACREERDPSRKAGSAVDASGGDCCPGLSGRLRGCRPRGRETRGSERRTGTIGLGAVVDIEEGMRRWRWRARQVTSALAFGGRAHRETVHRTGFVRRRHVNHPLKRVRDDGRCRRP